VAYDQRGFPYPRLVGIRPDIGAFESALLGDFNQDGNLDCADVNALVAVIAARTHLPGFDLTDDRPVDLQDLDRWLALAGAMPGSPTGGIPFRNGDANLDGQVNLIDFGIWNTYKFTIHAAWCLGDFNADGFIDGSDFGIWNSNKSPSSADLSVSPAFEAEPPIAERAPRCCARLWVRDTESTGVNAPSWLNGGRPALTFTADHFVSRPSAHSVLSRCTTDDSRYAKDLIFAFWDVVSGRNEGLGIL
jgi:hypothetical protein